MRIGGYLFCLCLLAAAALACFSPKQPGCAFSCVTDGRCPTDYHCADDGLCHRDDGQGTCSLPPQVDAGATEDAQPLDSGDDADGNNPP